MPRQPTRKLRSNPSLHRSTTTIRIIRGHRLQNTLLRRLIQHLHMQLRRIRGHTRHLRNSIKQRLTRIRSQRFRSQHHTSRSSLTTKIDHMGPPCSLTQMHNPRINRIHKLIHLGYRHRHPIFSNNFIDQAGNVLS
nr:MAG TPA: hypothetical protein [Caudoviricetes sp.]